MPAKVDEVLQNANGLKRAVDNHEDVIISRAEGQKKRDKLDADIQDLATKNSAQAAAQFAMEQRTRDQDSAMRNASVTVTFFQNAARSAFTNRVTLKEFKIGANKPSSVKAMVTLLAYLTGVVLKYRAELLANGVTEEDITSLSTVYANLIAADAVQENAKKLRNAATKSRDASLSTLIKTMASTRAYAKVIFKDDKAALEEFKPISRGRGKSGGDTTADSAPPPQA